MLRHLLAGGLEVHVLPYRVELRLERSERVALAQSPDDDERAVATVFEVLGERRAHVGRAVGLVHV